MTMPAKDEIGQHIRHRRRAKRLSLQDMSNATGLSVSTLSKIENNIIELSYTRMIAISEALGTNLTELTNADVGSQPSVVTTRRSINRSGEGSIAEDANYVCKYLNTDISKKQMIPAIVTVKHRSVEEFGPMSQHTGEEFILVLKGEIELHTEFYSPVRLKEGDSLYIDSSMPHAMITVSKDASEILSVCTHEIQTARQAASAEVVSQPAAPERTKRPRSTSKR